MTFIDAIFENYLFFYGDEAEQIFKDHLKRSLNKLILTEAPIDWYSMQHAMDECIKEDFDALHKETRNPSSSWIGMGEYRTPGPTRGSQN